MQRNARRILLLGMTMVLVGLAWGFVVPLTPMPRLALVAHIQAALNGLLFIALATLLLALPHRVGQGSVQVMLAAAWLTWPMLLSQMANAWWGTNEILPIAAEQAGATGGLPWQELVLKATHVVAGIAVLVAWVLLVAGFRPQASDYRQE
jgi:hydroxylaminobenzene mutase